jgi:hypothetical protein
LPLNSISMRCVQSGTSKNSSRGTLIDGTVWSCESGIIESAIAQPFYKTVFTILEYKAYGARINDDIEETPDAFDHFRSFSR